MDSVSVKTGSGAVMDSFSRSSNHVNKASIPTDNIIKCDTTFCDSRTAFCDKQTLRCEQCSSVCQQQSSQVCRQICPDYRLPRQSSKPLPVSALQNEHVPSKEHSQVIGGIIGSLALVVLVAAGVIVYTSGRGSKRRARRRAAGGPGNIYNGPITSLGIGKQPGKQCGCQDGGYDPQNVQSWLETGLLLSNKAGIGSPSCHSLPELAAPTGDCSSVVVIPYSTVRRWYLKQSTSDNTLQPADVHSFLAKMPATSLEHADSVSEDSLPDSTWSLTGKQPTELDTRLELVGSVDSGFVEQARNHVVQVAS